MNYADSRVKRETYVPCANHEGIWAPRILHLNTRRVNDEIHVPDAIHPGKELPIHINPLKPNDAYICRTAPLTFRCCILYIYSTHISTAYFKHAANSPFFPLQNVVSFIILHCLVPVLFAFYIQDVLKFKCKIQAPKG